MKKMRAVDAFTQLGAETNDRYAWSAQSADGAVTVLTLWEDEIEDDGQTVRVDFFSHPKLEIWKEQRRNSTRRRHLKDVWSGDRLFRVVMLRAKDVKAVPRATAARWPEESLIMTLEAFDPESGAFRAKGTRAVAAPTKSGDRWSMTELDACVKAYHSLWLAQQDGTPISKSAIREKVLARELHIRNKSAYERRMQNISSVTQELGLGFVIGYPPLQNIGSAKALLLEMVNRHWHRTNVPEQPTGDMEAFATRVQSANLKIQKATPPPPGQKVVARVTATSKQFIRDPNVVAWVCTQADGVCETCGMDATFTRDNDEPYLEVHHMRPLGEGGPDTIDNAIAACPTCHRRLHHGSDRRAYRTAVIAKVERLINYPKKEPTID